MLWMYTLCTVIESAMTKTTTNSPPHRILLLVIHVRVKKNRLRIRGIIDLDRKESCFRQRILGKAHTQSRRIPRMSGKSWNCCPMEYSEEQETSPPNSFAS